jgi:large subunit ribosomal protein L14
MLKIGTELNIADNTGAKKGKLIGIPFKGNKSNARLGEIITISVKDALPHNEIKKGDIVYAVVIRTKKEFRRNDGSYIRFDDNACVILQSKTIKEPKGTRTFGPICKEIKDLKFNKIASLAEELY